MAIHIRLVDMPDARKTHLGSVPLVGGISILFGLVIGLLMLKQSLMPYRVLFAACLIIAFFGVIDDFHELSHRKKFLAQFFVAFLIVFLGHAGVYHLGNLIGLGELNLKSLSVPFSILAVVVIINAMNMLDGMDGLMGSVAFFQFAFLGIVAYLSGRMAGFEIIILIMSTLLGFLCFNFPFKRRALIFMGDTGSMLIGLLLVWFLMTLADTHQLFARPITLLWIMAFPLYDMVNVVFRRIKLKRSPFHADREHFHHVFQNTGINDSWIVIVLVGFSILMGFLGLLMSYYKVQDYWMFLLFVIVFALYAFLMGRFGRIFKSRSNKERINAQKE